MTTREQVEAEAADLYPDPLHPQTSEDYRIAQGWRRAAHVRAKTVSAEQLEAAMKAYHEGWRVEGDGRRLHQSGIEFAFRAAGFLVEGDSDE